MLPSSRTIKQRLSKRKPKRLTTDKLPVTSGPLCVPNQKLTTSSKRKWVPYMCNFTKQTALRFFFLSSRHIESHALFRIGMVFPRTRSTYPASPLSQFGQHWNPSPYDSAAVRLMILSRPCQVSHFSYLGCPPNQHVMPHAPRGQEQGKKKENIDLPHHTQNKQMLLLCTINKVRPSTLPCQDTPVAQ